VAAEAMPYHRHRRAECNTAVGRLGVAAERDSRVRRPRRRRSHGWFWASVSIESLASQYRRVSYEVTTRQRGIPGPGGPNHGRGPTRRARARVGAKVRRTGSPGRRRSPAPAGLPASGKHRRGRGRPRARWRRRARPSTFGSRRRICRHRGPPDGRSAARCRRRDGCAHRRGVAVGTEQGVHGRRGRASGRFRGMRSVEPPGVHRGGTSAPAAGCRSRGCATLTRQRRQTQRTNDSPPRGARGLRRDNC